MLIYKYPNIFLCIIRRKNYSQDFSTEHNLTRIQPVRRPATVL